MSSRYEPFPPPPGASQPAPEANSGAVPGCVAHGKPIKARITIEIEAPSDVSNDDFLEWLDFETGRRNELKLTNPLEYAELRGFKKAVFIKII